MLPGDEHDFSCMYLAWLQCGCDTYPVDEQEEREQRQNGAPLISDRRICIHGQTALTCRFCYLREWYGLR